MHLPVRHAGVHFFLEEIFGKRARGAILIGAEWDEKIPTWPLLLQKAGYHLGYTYKVWSPGNPRDAGIGGSANAFRTAGGKFNGFSQYVSGRSRRIVTLEKKKPMQLRKPRMSFTGKSKETSAVSWIKKH